MTEPELIERLIAEAAHRGRIERICTDLTDASQDVGDALEKANNDLDGMRKLVDAAQKQNADLRKEIHEARENEQKSLYMLHDIVEAARAVSQKRRSSTAWLHLAGRMIVADEHLERWVPF